MRLFELRENYSNPSKFFFFPYATHTRGQFGRRANRIRDTSNEADFRSLIERSLITAKRKKTRLREETRIFFLRSRFRRSRRKIRVSGKIQILTRVRDRVDDGRMYTNVTNNFRKPHRGDCDAAERAANDPCPSRGVVARIVPVENVGEREKKRSAPREGSVSFRRGAAYDQVARWSAG